MLLSGLLPSGHHTQHTRFSMIHTFPPFSLTVGKFSDCTRSSPALRLTHGSCDTWVMWHMDHGTVLHMICLVSVHKAELEIDWWNIWWKQHPRLRHSPWHVLLVTNVPDLADFLEASPDNGTTDTTNKVAIMTWAQKKLDDDSKRGEVWECAPGDEVVR